MRRRKREPTAPVESQRPGCEDNKSAGALLKPSIVPDIFAKAFAMNPAAVAVSRLDDGTIMEVNEAWQKMFGYNRDEALGRSAITLNLWPMSEDRDLFAQELREKSVFGEREQLFLKKSGERFVTVGSAVLMRIGGEELVLSTWLDITERKRNRESIQRQAATLEGINNVLGAALSCETEENLGVVCLEAVERLTQSKIGFIGEITEKGLEDIAVSDPGWSTCKIADDASHRKPPGNFQIHGIYGRVLSEGKGLFTNDPAHHSDRIGVPEGHPPLESFLGVPLIHEGRTIGMIAVGNRPGGYSLVEQQTLEALAPTIVEAFMRKRAEEALRKSEARLSHAQKVAEVGSWEWEIETGAILWSEQTYRQMGEDPDRFMPSRDTFEQRLHSEDRATFIKAMEQALLHKSPFDLEFRIIRPNGEIRMLHSRGEVASGPDGQPLRMLGVCTDITERKRAQVSLQEANALLEQKVQERTGELARRAAQLRALAGELTLSEQRERSRLAKVLHDHLQQLLVAAKFRVTILGRGVDDIVKEAAREVEELIDESIAASRSLTAELSPPILHEAGLNAGLRWLAKQMGDKQGLFVDLETEEIGTLPEDKKILLFESVRELLFNVVKHAHTRSASVNLRRVNGSLQVTVSDQGVGFDPVNMTLVGERGAGFGLFGIRERLGLIGGTIEVESSPGHGSRFVLSLPITDSPTLKQQPQNIPGLREVSVSSASIYPDPGRKIRVLLADDHAVVRQGIANLLGDEFDMEVVGQAANGREAVELAAKLMPDVMLMDLSMPKLNGVEATRAIANDYPGIRIIGLSMFEERERMQAMLDAGAVSYLSKSGPSAELIDAIRKCMIAQANPNRS